MTSLQDVHQHAPAGQGLGIDLVHVKRIEEKLDNHAFLERLFHPQELDDAGSGPMRAARLAARWAAKEAFAKAVGCGFGEELTWADVSVVRDDRGAPSLILSQRARDRHGNPVTLLSISHDGDYAIAVVWILSRTLGEDAE